MVHSGRSLRRRGFPQCHSRAWRQSTCGTERRLLTLPYTPSFRFFIIDGSKHFDGIKPKGQRGSYQKATTLLARAMKAVALLMSTKPNERLKHQQPTKMSSSQRMKKSKLTAQLQYLLLLWARQTLLGSEKGQIWSG